MKEMCYWPKSGMVEFGEYAIDLMEERAVMGFFIHKLSLYDVKVAHFLAENKSTLSSIFALDWQHPPGCSATQ